MTEALAPVLGGVSACTHYEGKQGGFEIVVMFANGESASFSTHAMLADSGDKENAGIIITEAELLSIAAIVREA